MIDTIVNICGIEFKNPVIAASGTFGFGREYEEYFDISKLGGICTKGLTLHNKEGNKGIRIYETSSGLLNSIGLQTQVLIDLYRMSYHIWKKLDTVILANVGGSTIEEYIESIIKLNNTSVDIIELNISCPNVKEGGMAFGIKSKIAYEIVKEVRNVCKKTSNCKTISQCRKYSGNGRILYKGWGGRWTFPCKYF